jgi:hypothetical protein
MKLCLALSTVLLCFSACGDDGGGDDGTITPDAAGPDAEPLSAECIEAANHSDLAWIQAEIFTPGCASFSVCHMGAAASAGGLNLEDGMSQAAMVNIDSVRFTDWQLVVPGDPDNSYLMAILGDVEGPLADGIGTMPFNNPTLCQPKLDAIRRWIGSL